MRQDEALQTCGTPSLIPDIMKYTVHAAGVSVQKWALAGFSEQRYMSEHEGELEWVLFHDTWLQQDFPLWEHMAA